jgi:hypothetical protein
MMGSAHAEEEVEFEEEQPSERKVFLAATILKALIKNGGALFDFEK